MLFEIALSVVLVGGRHHSGLIQTGNHYAVGGGALSHMVILCWSSNKVAHQTPGCHIKSHTVTFPFPNSVSDSHYCRCLHSLLQPFLFVVTHKVLPFPNFLLNFTPWLALSTTIQRSHIPVNAIFISVVARVKTFPYLYSFTRQHPRPMPSLRVYTVVHSYCGVLFR